MWILNLLKATALNSVLHYIEGTYKGWLLLLSDLAGWWMVLFVVFLLQRA